MYTYNYTFSNEGVISNYKNILAYSLCDSVVDHRDLTVDKLIYLASEIASNGPFGPKSGFDIYLDSLMKTWNALRAIDPLPVAGTEEIQFPALLPVQGTAWLILP
jgi:hypothetical protein